MVPNKDSRLHFLGKENYWWFFKQMTCMHIEVIVIITLNKFIINNKLKILTRPKHPQSWSFRTIAMYRMDWRRVNVETGELDLTGDERMRYMLGILPWRRARGMVIWWWTCMCVCVVHLYVCLGRYWRVYMYALWCLHDVWFFQNPRVPIISVPLIW